MSIYKQIKRLHRKIFVNTSPFAKCAVAALVISIGDLISTTTDIGWALGEYITQHLAYDPYILVGLVIALLVMAASLYWLYVSIYKFLKNKEVKRQKRQLLRVHAVSHCGNFKNDKYTAPEYQQEYVD